MLGVHKVLLLDARVVRVGAIAIGALGALTAAQVEDVEVEHHGATGNGRHDAGGDLRIERVHRD